MRQRLLRLQERAREYYDKKHQPLAPLKPGDKVLLVNPRPTATRPSEKLAHRKVGPYEVIEPIGKQAYRIRIPHQWKMHNVFHVSKLEPYRSSKRFPQQPPPEPETDDGELAYFVRQIVKVRWNKRKRALEYLVDWEGYGKEDATWEPLENLLVDDEPIFALEKFRRENPLAEAQATAGKSR